MKTKILLLVLLSTLNLPPATGFGQTNLPYVVDIITLHTNNGVVTKGDPLPTAFGKVNSNAQYFQAQITALQTNSATGNATNAILKSFGTGNDTTISNAFTLVNTNLYWTTTLLNLTGFYNTNCPGGFFPSDNFLTTLTDACGDTVFNSHIPTCTNVAGPYTLNTNYEAPVLKNACGFMVLTNYSTTNASGPYLLVTNLGPDVYVNFFGYVVMGNVCPNQNGPYYPDWPLGVGMMTNFCGDIVRVSPMSTNSVFAVSSIVVANGDIGAGTYSALDANGALFTQYQYFGGKLYWCWGYYVTNAWRFFYATNAAFSSPNTVTVNGTVNALMYVTNCPLVPDTNTVYQSSSTPYNTVAFSESVIGAWYTDVNGNIFGWGSSPPNDPISITIWPPGTTVTNYPPAPGSPSSAPTCNGNYITLTLSGVRKYLIPGQQWYETANTIDWRSGIYTSYVSIGIDGYAAFYLAGVRVQEAYWTDASQWTTSVPGDACPTDCAVPCVIY